MKKIIALLSAVVLTLSMAVTAFAQPSVQVNGIVYGIQTAMDAEGRAARFAVRGIPDDYKTVADEIKKVENVKKILGDAYLDGMQVIDVREVVAEGDVTYPVTITFKVTGVTANSKVALLYYNKATGEWVKVEATAGDGTITATLEGASLVAFIVDGETAKAAEKAGTSPKTGESSAMMYAGVVAAMAALGMVVIGFNRKREV